jgi:chaperonin GroEL
MKLDKFSWEWFGEARTVTISKEKTTIIDGKGKEEDVKERLEEITSQIDKSQSNFETEKLQERLAKMAGGVSIIHVGGYTETEMNEKKDRVDDALHATKAAIEEGKDSWTGYNIKNETIANMKKEGIIDPTKVTRTALENAASVAGTLLLTECIVVDEPKEEKNPPQIDPSMMGMGM